MFDVGGPLRSHTQRAERWCLGVGARPAKHATFGPKKSPPALGPARRNLRVEDEQKKKWRNQERRVIADRSSRKRLADAERSARRRAGIRKATCILSKQDAQIRFKPPRAHSQESDKASTIEEDGGDAEVYYCPRALRLHTFCYPKLDMCRVLFGCTALLHPHVGRMVGRSCSLWVCIQESPAYWSGSRTCPRGGGGRLG